MGSSLLSPLEPSNKKELADVSGLYLTRMRGALYGSYLSASLTSSTSSTENDDEDNEAKKRKTNEVPPSLIHALLQKGLGKREVKALSRLAMAWNDSDGYSSVERRSTLSPPPPWPSFLEGSPQETSTTITTLVTTATTPSTRTTHHTLSVSEDLPPKEKEEGYVVPIAPPPLPFSVRRGCQEEEETFSGSEERRSTSLTLPPPPPPEHAHSSLRTDTQAPSGPPPEPPSFSLSPQVRVCVDPSFLSSSSSSRTSSSLSSSSFCVSCALKEFLKKQERHPIDRASSVVAVEVTPTVEEEEKRREKTESVEAPCGTGGVNEKEEDEVAPISPLLLVDAEVAKTNATVEENGTKATSQDMEPTTVAMTDLFYTHLQDIREDVKEVVREVLTHSTSPFLPSVTHIPLPPPFMTPSSCTLQKEEELPEKKEEEFSSTTAPTGPAALPLVTTATEEEREKSVRDSFVAAKAPEETLAKEGEDPLENKEVEDEQRTTKGSSTPMEMKLAHGSAEGNDAACPFLPQEVKPRPPSRFLLTSPLLLIEADTRRAMEKMAFEALGAMLDMGATLRQSWMAKEMAESEKVIATRHLALATAAVEEASAAATTGAALLVVRDKCATAEHAITGLSLQHTEEKAATFVNASMMLQICQEETHVRHTLEAWEEDVREVRLQAGHVALTAALQQQATRWQLAMEHQQQATELALQHAKMLEKKFRVALEAPTVILSPSAWESEVLGRPKMHGSIPDEEWDLPVHRRFARAHQEAVKVVRAQQSLHR